jgi:hypothetical protein
MPGIVPVAAPNPAPVEPTGAVGPYERHTGLTSERKLFEYVAELQAQSMLSGKALQLANPAALGGETLRLMQGYFDRANKLQDMNSKKVQFMGEDSSERAKAPDERDAGDLHAGPASRNFEPALGGSQGSAAKVDAIGDTDLDRTVEMLMRVLNFAVETNLVASGSGAVSRSVNTLIRGQ